jgi:ferredoxin
MGDHLRVNPILCDAHGHCAELLPELIRLDEWGYPIVADGPIPRELRKDVRRAVSMCPRLALLVDQRKDSGLLIGVDSIGADGGLGCTRPGCM